jgi:hypothetical protein
LMYQQLHQPLTAVKSPKTDTPQQY